MDTQDKTKEDTQEKGKVAIPASISVKHFSERLKMTPAEIITILMKNGVMASINEEIDFDTASIIAQDLGYSVTQERDESEITKEKGVRKKLIEELNNTDEDDLKERPPVVAVMGHVDHGKTKLLDTIRQTNVIDEESGGITQHIGAYQVRKKGKLITFLDTPGHEAFASMRERGAKVTDIAILIVAADDGVKPQTKEAIKHIKNAGIPMIVAINKIDKPEADPERVKKELSDHGVMPEDWGGDTIFVNISAKQKTNIDELLDMILLVSDIANLKANPKTKAIGTVIESNKDSQRGIEATILIQNGTLALGDVVTIGPIFGKIKLIENYLGKKVNHAKPSTPVKILGLESVPDAGDILFTEESLEKAKQKISKLNKIFQPKIVKSADNESNKKQKKLNIIIKADVQGSVEAILESLAKIKSDDVKANIINYGAGKITESDVMMASSSSAFIAGFNSEPSSVAKRMAEDLKVEIKTFSVIYDLIDNIKSKLESLIEPEVTLKTLGTLDVLKLFRTEKGKMIVGGRVSSKHLENNTMARIFRDDKEVGQGKIISLQSGKIDVNEVKQGEECGIVFEGQVKVKEGDRIETWKEVVTKKTL